MHSERIGLHNELLTIQTSYLTNFDALVNFKYLVFLNNI